MGLHKFRQRIMQHIAAQVRHSDFIINVNESALGRIAGVQPNGSDHGPNASMVQGLRAKVPQYAWMLDETEWQKRLGKRQKAKAKKTVNHKAMRGRVILIANFISDGVSKILFERGSE